MIFGDNIRLRPPERTDLPMFIRWFQDPEILRGIGLYSPISLAEEEQWFENMLKLPKDERPLVIEILDDKKWFPIGNCGYHFLDWRNRSCEIGIVIGEKQQWNQGYGTSVVRLMLKYGFDTLNFNRIGLRVFEYNKGGIRAYEKAGFIHEGKHRKAEYYKGEYHDILFMSVLRSEWKEDERNA